MEKPLIFRIVGFLLAVAVILFIAADYNRRAGQKPDQFVIRARGCRTEPDGSIYCHLFAAEEQDFSRWGKCVLDMGECRWGYLPWMNKGEGCWGGLRCPAHSAY